MLTSYEDVYVLFDSIITRYPEFASHIKDYFFCNNHFTLCNMMLMKTELYNQYCNFIFSILDDVDCKGKISGYSRQRRVLGYLSEAMIGFWCEVTGQRVKYVDICEPFKSSSLKKLRRPRWSKGIKTNLFFKLSSHPKKGDRLFQDWVLNGLNIDNVQIINKDFTF